MFLCPMLSVCAGADLVFLVTGVWGHGLGDMGDSTWLRLGWTEAGLGRLPRGLYSSAGVWA